ncbi:MAG: prepilin-type N-terminal cleavage/methylation domain-containing protein, partial [Candidatus Moranbacteria bacterium]|nr:prepilin-type N-terminal cleavage/methylation domain-containing protein [Candidatus Moranbacteria bacterium]
MFVFQKKKKNFFSKAFTLIEVLLVIFIASIVVVTFLNVFTQGSRLLLESKKSLVATSLANEYMEIIRNLSYENVGVSGGIPSGPLQATEIKEKNGTSYNIYTDVRYKDDPYDGVLGGSPNDFVNTDYKLVTIRVFWGSGSSQQEIRLSSIFVPPGIETNLGAGTLAINIIDSFGMGVPFVNITLKNDSEGISFSTLTDELGNVLIPGAPESQQSYEIMANKLSYEIISTYPPYPLSLFTPIDEHSSVLEGELTNKVMVMNSLTQLNILIKDFAGKPLSDIP